MIQARAALPLAAWLGVLAILAPILALLIEGVSGLLHGIPGRGLLARSVVTVEFALGTAALACVWGVSSAWLVETCRFPGRRLLAFGLFLPFAIPPYLSAYVWADLLDDGGWLPVGVGVRNLAGACLVMSLVLYPYVYMFARASFANRSAGLMAAARLLGNGPWRSFLRVALPAARPAIAAGALLVFMETANDIAVAEDYGLHTLGHHVYDLWQNRGEQGRAAAVAVLLALLALALAYGESVSRSRQRQYQQGVRHHSGSFSFRLSGGRAWLASAWCGGLLLLAFAVPVLSLAGRLEFADAASLRSALGAAGGSVRLVVCVALLGLALGVALSYLRRRGGGEGIRSGLARLALVGYAFPGTIYALGALAAASALAGWAELAGVPSLRWIWVTSSALLVLALSCRFVAVTWGAIESGLAQVPPSLVAVARNSGKGATETVARVHLPLMRPALLAGLLLLAVDVLKELPLTLILRPFGLDTLALQIYQFAADEDLINAVPASLLLIAITTAILAAAYRWLVPAWMRNSGAAGA